MFHIIDDWYIVPDGYCWMVGRKVGVSVSKGIESPKFKDQIYQKDPADALKSFCSVYARRSAQKRSGGELSDLVIILSSEYEKLQKCIENAFAEIEKKGGITNG